MKLATEVIISVFALEFQPEAYIEGSSLMGAIYHKSLESPHFLVMF